MTNVCDLAPDYIRAIAPYQPGKPIDELARELGLDASRIVKLASNENPLGASPKALIAIDAAMDTIARYPDGSGFDLKAALADKFNVDAAQVVLGNGSNDVLEMAARAFLSSATSAVFSEHAFAVYPLATLAVGATGITAPAKDYGHDLAAMLAAIRADTRMVFIANPNNPTGTLLSNADMLAFLEQVPSQVIVVLDEAYGEYLPQELQSDALIWLARFPNLIVTRTFSKAYGLAGLRVGYALASAAVADMLNRVRQPFNVNSLALVAATAALNDDEFIARSYALNQLGMRQLTQGLHLLNIDYIPSYANFLAIRIGNATAMYRRLLEHGVIVRPIGNYGMPEYLRVSIGLAAENNQFLQALEDAIKD
ncbi:histidinol-phosphate transaminase [Sulfuriferula nivalis]|uniref:Histidinol-phosphate aminotransferase n=1 Tax=Sulfuriferula nivalis TaxID=2675298 RepID=A0A809RGH4_9PROT|nr:histidinol-phosphate transaminase [Sulfuriferula nivalis]BBP00675.1 histidinol-phosphate aminotransferase 2 [Sulfuriferula nivalis]